MRVHDLHRCRQQHLPGQRAPWGPPGPDPPTSPPTGVRVGGSDAFWLVIVGAGIVRAGVTLPGVLGAWALVVGPGRLGIVGLIVDGIMIVNDVDAVPRLVMVYSSAQVSRTGPLPRRCTRTPR
ncbi:hypothetical protein UK99_04010 [Frankia casuarinae]|nr:hypothetical protein UK99_04010 [Frankia casuarinae]